MTDKKDGGPAFPPSGYCPEGMTLRDWFASVALHGSMGGLNKYNPGSIIAKNAYAVADAMIEESDK